ncbi:hypothetical protein ONZ45_g1598 [Pleurotus djamor]|nr:hypothetical protein ONZ45_g1598 [Pleurotus djamor]
MKEISLRFDKSSPRNRQDSYLIFLPLKGEQSNRAHNRIGNNRSPCRSPNNIAQYGPHSGYQPDSPVNTRPHLAPRTTSLPIPGLPMERPDLMLPPRAHGFMTPESSPLHQRTTLPRIPELSGDSTSVTPRGTSHAYRTPTYPSLQASPLGPNGGLAPAPEITPSPTHTPSAHDNSRSTLSSPFVTRLNLADRLPKIDPPSSSPIASLPPSPTTKPATVNDLFSTPQRPPLSPPAGGELDRINQARRQDQLVQAQEAETRRPEYLKRVKRSISEVDLPTEEEDRLLGAGVGITESPQKGRRLKLFQETSEESFEESLMAGGYGRYRTAEWVRQPQPLPSPHLAGPSNVVSLLEAEAAPTEQDLQKKRRLDAFRGSPSRRSATKTTLQIINLEGGGRALVEAPAEPEVHPPPEASPAKKRTATRRKKKGAVPDSEVIAKEELVAVLAASQASAVDGPNWLDSEFPWKLRTDERTQMQQLEEQEKMKWIERFLDRDTDDEDAEGGEATIQVEYQESWDSKGDEKPDGYRPGRGKWVPLNVDPYEQSADTRRKAFFPTDPADARAALLAKRSIRALSFRQQLRQRDANPNADDEEVLCVCHGGDDGRELVQCDSCQTWYHLQCIGIKDISELGREEDPWFCRNCEEEKASNGSDDIDMADVLASEPTFVPSEDEPIHARRTSRPSPFFHTPGPEDSPMPPWSMPRTPTRSRQSDNQDIGSGMSSSTWVYSSRPGPSTPRQSAHSTKLYTTPISTSTPYRYEESPFDPTSTPSRGIKFGAPFGSPKSHSHWSNRAQNPFHTPKYSLRDVSHHADRSSGVAPYEMSANGETPTAFRPHILPSNDESPIRRTTSLDRPPRQNVGRRGMEPRTLSLTESPIPKSRESFNGPPPPAARRDFLPTSMSALSM